MWTGVAIIIAAVIIRSGMADAAQEIASAIRYRRRHEWDLDIKE